MTNLQKANEILEYIETIETRYVYSISDFARSLDVEKMRKAIIYNKETKKIVERIEKLDKFLKQINMGLVEIFHNYCTDFKFGKYDGKIGFYRFRGQQRGLKGIEEVIKNENAAIYRRIKLLESEYVGNNNRKGEAKNV